MDNPKNFQFEDILEYIDHCAVRESDALKSLREATDTEAAEHAMLRVTRRQAQFLNFLVKLTSAKNVIELGVFTGYSTLAIAEALPRDGKLIACELSDLWPRVGKPFWQKAGVSDKIVLKFAPAMETLNSLLSEGSAEHFDLIFIDADKANYPNYYELALKLLRPGGLIIFDNMLYIGDAKVMDRGREGCKIVDDLNHKIKIDTRVEICMIPLDTGFLLVRKI